MSEGRPEERIRELARDLTPVRPVPRLRVVGAAAVGVWLLGLFTESLLTEPGQGIRAWSAWSDPSFAAIALGLALVSVGATAAALAGAIPGREADMRLGITAAGAGILMALAGGGWGWLQASVGGGEAPLGDCLSCMGRAAGLGIPSTLLACGFIIYAVVRHPGVDTAFAVLGGVGLGALAVHATCPDNSALHQLAAHSLAPLAAAALLTLPLAALAARATRRS